MSGTGPADHGAGAALVDREALGRLVRRVWVEWAFEQPNIEDHPSWLLTWSELDDGQREVDMRIGAAVAERCAQLAEQAGAEYPWYQAVTVEGREAQKPVAWRPFAALLRQDGW